MLVFYAENLVFLSVPKTGTTAYHSALRDRADLVISGPPLLKHAPLYRYNRFLRPMFRQVCDRDPEIMAIMREPISWLGSWYRYRSRPALAGQPNSTQGISFDAFVDAYCRGNRPEFANVGSQANFLASQPNGCAVTHLFRYEEPEKTAAFLRARLGQEVATRRENVSPSMELSLSPKTEAKLRRKCAEEFALYDSIA
jgi:hypothetical protein